MKIGRLGHTSVGKGVAYLYRARLVCDVLLGYDIKGSPGRHTGDLLFLQFVLWNKRLRRHACITISPTLSIMRRNQLSDFGLLLAACSDEGERGLVGDDGKILYLEQDEGRIMAMRLIDHIYEEDRYFFIETDGQRRKTHIELSRVRATLRPSNPAYPLDRAYCDKLWLPLVTQRTNRIQKLFPELLNEDLLSPANPLRLGTGDPTKVRRIYRLSDDEIAALQSSEDEEFECGDEVPPDTAEPSNIIEFSPDLTDADIDAMAHNFTDSTSACI